WYVVAPMTRLGFSWAGLEWVLQYYLFSQVAIGAAAILFCQYAYRATFATRIVATFGPILLFASSALLPWTTAFQLQRHFSKGSVDTSSIQVHLDLKRMWAGRIYLTDSREVSADLPIQ